MIPLVVWGLSFVAGAALGMALPGMSVVIPASTAVLCFLLLVSSLPFGTLKKGRMVFASVLFLALGAVRAVDGERAFTRQQASFPRPEAGVFSGWVAEDPEVLFEHAPGDHETGRGAGRYAPYVKRTRAVVVLTGLDGRPIRPVRARCSFANPKGRGAPILSYGDGVKVRGRLTLPAAAMNPGQFDYRRYLKNKGVAYVLFAAPWKWARVDAGRHGGAFARASYRVKRRIEDAVYSFLPYPENALLSGLLLGERASLSEEMLDAFAVTGTTHILAVSGMNTALIAALLFFGFRILRAPRKAAAVLSMLALASYVFMTGAPPSVCRAALFSGFALLSLLLERKPHAGVLLVLTAALLVAWNPSSLADLSFQLSFLAVMGLAVVTPPVFKRRGKVPAFVAGDFAATFGAQMAVWGLLVFEFNQFATYSLPANLLIAPLVAAATAGGFAAILAHLLHPALGALLGAGVGIPLKLITLVTTGLSKWPAAEVVVGTPPVPWMAAYHVLLLAFFLVFWPGPRPEAPSGAWNKRERIFRAARRMVAAAWILFLAAAGLAALWEHSKPRPFLAAFLYVGHGNAAVLRTPEGKTMVVDGGLGTNGPPRWSTLVRYLRHEGIRRVDAVVNTHPDADHIGGLVDLVLMAKVGAAYQPTGSGIRSEIAAKFADLITEKGIPFHYLRRGETPGLLKGASVSVLHPPERFRTRRHRDNNLSLVLRVSYPGDDPTFTLVMPGDIEREGLDALWGVKAAKSDWLMAPHHGRAPLDNTAAAILFKPRFVVVSDGKDNPDTEKALRGLVDPPEILALNRMGCLEVTVDSQRTIKVRRFVQENRDPIEDDEGL